MPGDLENAGALVALYADVSQLRAVSWGIEVSTQEGTRLLARTVVNAAGLSACDLSQRTEGLVWCFVLDGTNKTDGFLVLTRRKPQP